MPSALLDRAGWDRITRRVGHLPALAVARRAGFEMRLSDPAPAADVVVALGTGGELFSHYRDRGRTAATGPTASLGRFLGEVSRRPDDWRWLRGVMLEYDVAKIPSGARRAPGVFLGLRPGIGSETRLGGRPVAEVLAECLAGVAGWDRDPDECRVLANAVASIPPQAELMQAGAMPGREPRLLRMTVVFARAGQIPGFLTGLGWPGALAEVDRVLNRMADAAPSVFAVSLGVGARAVDARIGLEIYRNRGGETLGTWTNTTWEDWRPLVGRLEEEGWCLPVKGEGLSHLPGLHRIVGGAGVSLLYLGINHLKIDLGTDQVRAKAYAGMKFIPAGGPDFGA